MNLVTGKFIRFLIPAKNYLDFLKVDFCREPAWGKDLKGLLQEYFYKVSLPGRLKPFTVLSFTIILRNAERG